MHTCVGCWMRSSIDSDTARPSEFIYNDDPSCTPASLYLCSTNDANTGGVRKTLPVPEVQNKTFPETSVLESTFESSSESSSAMCAPTLQEKLDKQCRRAYPGAAFARYDSSTDNARLPELRCFDGNSLDFDAEGLCLADDGTCRECPGDRVSTTGVVYDADAMLKAFIRDTIGKNVTCEPTLQHRMNHWCATNANLPFARAVTTRLGFYVWGCYASSSLDFGTSSRECVDNDGFCDTCKGKVSVSFSSAPSETFNKALRVRFV